jgi:ABC-type proline/glycine betaine transport system substrate-binding protein
MKRKILYVCALVLMATGFSSCEDTCKTCKQVTYINGSWDHEGTASQYCGAELLAVEAMQDVVIGNSRTAWECN